jgi:hypothetical protein
MLPCRPLNTSALARRGTARSPAACSAAGDRASARHLRGNGESPGSCQYVEPRAPQRQNQAGALQCDGPRARWDSTALASYCPLCQRARSRAPTAGTATARLRAICMSRKATDDRLAARPDLQPADARVRAGHERHELVRRLLPELRADVVAPQRSRAAATSTRPRSSLVNGSRCRPARADAAWRGRMPGQSLGAVFALERPIAGHERTARGREPWRGADGRGQPAVSDRQAVPSRVPACATRTHGRP